MAEDKIITGGRVYRRAGTNGIWWMDFRVNGKRYRRSTGWKTLPRAEEALRSTREALLVHAADHKNAKIAVAAAVANWPEVHSALPWVRLMLAQAKRNAKRRKIDFLLKLDDLVSILRASGGRCAISNVAFSEESFGGWHPYRPSLDRTESGGPYSSANCRIICSCANMACHAWGEEVFRRVARSLVAAELLQNNGYGNGQAQQVHVDRECEVTV